MKRAIVNFEVAVPDHATDEQIREWIAFELNARGDMKVNNPLADSELEPTRGSLAVIIH